MTIKFKPKNISLKKTGFKEKKFKNPQGFMFS